MNRKITLTVCIPAYNEEENIVYLLKDIKKQKQSNFHLSHILVYSDGSTDNTVKLVKSINDPRITVIESEKREGIAQGLNTMLSSTNTDAIAVLNADILIKDVFFLSKLLAPVTSKHADLTSSDISEVRSQTFFEKVLQVSMFCKRTIFQNYKKGNNVYTCHGQARAFSKKLYQSIRFTKSIGEDAYSYLYCTFYNFSYVFAKDAVAYYRLPNNFSDHEKQSIRFIQSKKKFTKIFGQGFIDKEYRLPLHICILAVLSTTRHYPLHMLLYTAVFVGIQLESLFKKQLKETWVISRSSKTVRLVKSI